MPNSFVFPDARKRRSYPTTEECVALFQSIEGGVQLRNNGLGLISNHDRFHTDFLYSIGIPLPPILFIPAPKQTTSDSPQDYLRIADDTEIGVLRSR